MFYKVELGDGISMVLAINYSFWFFWADFKKRSVWHLSYFIR